MHSTSSALAVIVVLFLLMIIDVIGLKNLPEGVRLALEQVGQQIWWQTVAKSLEPARERQLVSVLARMAHSLK